MNKLPTKISRHKLLWLLLILLASTPLSTQAEQQESLLEKGILGGKIGLLAASLFHEHQLYPEISLRYELATDVAFSNNNFYVHSIL